MNTDKHFNVVMGNGGWIFYSDICQGVNVRIANTSFFVDLFGIPFQGADVVLVVDWLKKPGLLSFDYEALTIFFFLNG